MKDTEQKPVLAEQEIASRIYLIRNQSVMIDRDLAEMYGVETKVFNQSVKRNKERFPDDFMFTLSEQEWTDLRSQIVTSSWGGPRYRPKVFTEQGVAMLSGILNSRTAIEVNIRIMRAFTRLRKYTFTQREIGLQLTLLEKEVKGNTRDIEHIFAVLRELVERQYESRIRKRIGFEQGSSSSDNEEG